MTSDKIISVLPTTETGNIVMDLFNCMITPEDFIERFNGAELTYESLYNHQNATPGWKKQFDQWHKEGIIE